MAHKTLPRDALVVHTEDNVAVCLREVKAGEEVTVQRGKDAFTLIAKDTIPMGHKIALIDFVQGQPILKYGEIIGQATSSIRIAQHVHVHNVSDYQGEIQND